MRPTYLDIILLVAFIVWLVSLTSCTRPIVTIVIEDGMEYEIKRPVEDGVKYQWKGWI